MGKCCTKHADYAISPSVINKKRNTDHLPTNSTSYLHLKPEFRIGNSLKVSTNIDSIEDKIDRMMFEYELLANKVTHAPELQLDKSHLF